MIQPKWTITSFSILATGKDPLPSGDLPVLNLLFHQSVFPRTKVPSWQKQNAHFLFKGWQTFCFFIFIIYNKLPLYPTIAIFQTKSHSVPKGSSTHSPKATFERGRVGTWRCRWDCWYVSSFMVIPAHVCTVLLTSSAIGGRLFIICFLKHICLFTDYIQAPFLACSLQKVPSKTLQQGNCKQLKHNQNEEVACKKLKSKSI